MKKLLVYSILSILLFSCNKDLIEPKDAINAALSANSILADGASECIIKISFTEKVDLAKLAVSASSSLGSFKSKDSVILVEKNELDNEQSANIIYIAGQEIGVDSLVIRVNGYEMEKAITLELAEPEEIELSLSAYVASASNQAENVMVQVKGVRSNGKISKGQTLASFSHTLDLESVGQLVMESPENDEEGLWKGIYYLLPDSTMSGAVELTASFSGVEPASRQLFIVE